MKAIILNLIAWGTLPIMDGMAKYLSTQMHFVEVVWARYFFMVDPPVGNKGGSNQSQKGTRAEVFNTLDWISRANRKLWKINPVAGADSDFISRFGVLPFDPTEVAKVEKKRSKTVEEDASC